MYTAHWPCGVTVGVGYSVANGGRETTGKDGIFCRFHLLVFVFVALLEAV